MISFMMFFFVQSASKARIVAELPTGGLTSVRFAGTGGDFFVTVAEQIIDYNTGKTLRFQNPGTSLYQIRGLGSSVDFRRLRI